MASACNLRCSGIGYLDVAAGVAHLQVPFRLNPCNHAARYRLIPINMDIGQGGDSGIVGAGTASCAVRRPTCSRMAVPAV